MINDLVDFHSHVLPGADHGSSSVDTTQDQLRFAYEFGVSRVIATPHFYPTVHRVKDCIERREKAFSALKAIGSSVEVVLGAEVLICNQIENMPGLEKLFLSGTNTLLLELPFSDFQAEYCDSVYNLVNLGVDVVIAHADRYSPGNIEKLVDLGARLQLNADSLSRLFVKRHLLDWLKREIVVGLGSDIHGADRKAYASFSKVRSKFSDYLTNVKKESDKLFIKAKY